jgi:hypothetical protein
LGKIRNCATLYIDPPFWCLNIFRFFENQSFQYNKYSIDISSMEYQNFLQICYLLRSA